MSAVEYRFIEPLDVLFLRGNKLFGDPGSYGESLVPPWPSVAAGALRSRMLADDGVDLAAFARGAVTHPTLGTPQHPGTFAVTAFHLARRLADGAVELLIQPPADLLVSENEDGAQSVRPITPTRLATDGLTSSAPLPLLPLLAESERSKPASGYWLTEAGWKSYLAGVRPRPTDLVKSSALWKIDARVGVGLDAETRRAADGRLFSVQAVAMAPGIGFLAGISGAVPPKDGTLRLGGDGRAAAVFPVGTHPTGPDYGAISRARSVRLVLATPGLFAGGWLPAGCTQSAEGEFRFNLHGVRGKLVCAAVARAEVVSGWDLAKWQPKPSQRAAPTGSVYWLDELDATPDALRKLADAGLWSESGDDPQRRAEGFNRVWLAAWL